MAFLLVPPRTKRQTQGQSGPKIELTWEGLCTTERRVIRALAPKHGEHKRVMTIADIAHETGWIKREGKKKAYSWVRNSMRRLVRANFVAHESQIKDGRYLLTTYGLRQVRSKHRASKPLPVAKDIPSVTF